MPPIAANWRQQLTRLALPVFYHSVLWAAGETLDYTIFTDNWGAPPGHKRSGYAFLDRLAEHLVLARKLSGEDLDRFIHAARRQSILSGEGQEDSDVTDTLEAIAPGRASAYPDIDAEIERLVPEPELPYFLRTPRHKHKRKRR